MTLLPLVPTDPRAALPRLVGDHVTVGLRDGGTAHLRPLRRGETEPLLEVFAAMSEASRASRYLVGMSRLPRAVLAALTDVDGCRHAAWLATVDGRPAGIARYLRTAPGTAEVAFEVVDAHHGRGLGAVLVDAVTTVAAANGVRRVEATAMPGNHASVHLLRQLGLPLVAADGLLQGAATLQLLEPARVDRGAVVALAERARAATTAPSAAPHEAPAQVRAVASSRAGALLVRSFGTLVMKVSATAARAMMPITV
jgi:RimJ/RimL family protein N-acetyltransferase